MNSLYVGGTRGREGKGTSFKLTINTTEDYSRVSQSS